MENKSYKGLVWLLAILIILVVTLMGFILYREFYNEDKKDDITNITTKKISIDEESVDDNSTYISEWEGTAFDLKEKANVDMSTNFKNVNVKIGEIDFTLNCIGYNIQGGNMCDIFEILINGKSHNIKSSVQEENSIIVANDVVINTSYGSNKGTMKIINNNGNIIVEKEIIITYSDKNTQFNDVIPALKDGKLYFFTQKDNTTLYKNYIDFQNDFDEIQVEEIEGYLNEY